MVEAYFPPSEVEHALSVIDWESGGDANAKGDTAPKYRIIKDGTVYGYSNGLFQVRYLPGRPDRDAMTNPEQNVKYAAAMYKALRWCPWSSAHAMHIATNCGRH